MFKYAALLALVTSAMAQSPIYGQCGGKGWSGSTSCAAGSTCTYSNDYYSQCLPGSAGGSSSSTSTRTTTSTSVTSTATGGSTGTATSTGSTSTGTTVPTAGNPYASKSGYISPYYADEVNAAIASISDSSLKAKYAKVAQIPTFIWLDTAAKVPTLATYLAGAKAAGTVLQIVVYDLPDRDCAAKSSNGELSTANGGAAKYKAYIDAIVAQVKAYPDVPVVAVVEPDSLGNLVTNMNVAKCSAAADVYKSSIIYAMQQLDTVGVQMYLDAGHAGWLGWPANLTPAAQLFAQLYKAAGSPKSVRGLATNVSNYNAISVSTPDSITQGNPNYDELHYINALAPALTSQGFPAHFIVDQSRSGVQGIRQQWGDWCNIKGAGMGTRPTTNTGSSLIDSIVWVKPPGECDGTSNSSSPRYDSTCSLSDADQPAPEAGTWFQEYFNTLVVKANPPL
jgi:cellulose 1,4-beta-cellobiosidase